MTSKDNARSWVVLSIVTFGLFCEIGIIKAVSVLLPEIKEQLKTQTWIVGSSISIITGFGCVIGISSGGLVGMFSPRGVAMASGFIVTIGLILCSIATTPFTLLMGLILTGFMILQDNVLIGVIPDHFDKHYETAVAIYCCGSGVGLIIFPIVTQALLDLYGWRGALLLLGGVCFHSVPCGAFIGCSKSKDTKTHRGGVYEQLFSPENTLTAEKRDQNKCQMRRLFHNLKKASGLTLLKSFSYMTEVFIPAMIHGYTLMGWIIYVVSFAISIGFSIRQGSMVATSGGIGMLLTRIILPLLHNFMTYRQLIYISSVFMALSLSLTTAFDSYVALNVFAIVYGAGQGILGAELHIAAKANSTESEYHYAIAWCRVVAGISSIVSGLVSGILYDATGCFTISFNILAVISLLILVSLGLGDLRK